ncbi:MAG: ParB N-terminal domain-containing protein [Eubacterium sp.]|nr:ParB N-terminal domain-containing protein [Eubacterium sp.]
MALKTGKSIEDIKEIAARRTRLLEQGDITDRYSELLINVTPDDLGSVRKDNTAAFDSILDRAKDKVVELDIKSLSESPKNHFSKVSGEKREEMIGSLRSYGQINPIIVRPRECVEHYQDLIANDFEILVGHTRVDCLREIGSEKVKAIIVKCDDIEATLLINQSNIQREKVTDLELARAYKATYDALVQDKNNNLRVGDNKNKNVDISTDFPKCQSDTSGRTDEEVAKRYGISARTLTRKMALANCTDSIVKLYNRSKITQEEIQHLSKLPDAVQEQVCEILKSENQEMTKDIAKELLATYNKVQKNPPLRASFSWNILRNVIAEGQEEKIEEKRKPKGKVKKAGTEKVYKVKDELFPSKLKETERQRYIEQALQYILSHNIDILNLSIKKER